MNILLVEMRLENIRGVSLLFKSNKKFRKKSIMKLILDFIPKTGQRL
jgi:hypothetical protein